MMIEKIADRIVETNNSCDVVVPVEVSEGEGQACSDCGN
jgi:hypothetical protein